MSTLHLASSSSTAFFLQTDKPEGAWTPCARSIRFFTWGTWSPQDEELGSDPKFTTTVTVTMTPLGERWEVCHTLSQTFSHFSNQPVGEGIICHPHFTEVVKMVILTSGLEPRGNQRPHTAQGAANPSPKRPVAMEGGDLGLLVPSFSLAMPPLKDLRDTHVCKGGHTGDHHSLAHHSSQQSGDWW